MDVWGSVQEPFNLDPLSGHWTSSCLIHLLEGKDLCPRSLALLSALRISAAHESRGQSLSYEACVAMNGLVLVTCDSLAFSRRTAKFTLRAFRVSCLLIRK